MADRTQFFKATLINFALVDFSHNKTVGMHRLLKKQEQFNIVKTR